MKKYLFQQPIELWSAEVIDQKMNYVHNNPVQVGFVLQPEHWKSRSAIDHKGGMGVVGNSFHEARARSSNSMPYKLALAGEASFIVEFSEI